MYEVMESKLINILLVEDSPTDVLLTREAFEQAKLRLKLHVVEDGEAAMDFLEQKDPYSDVPRPDLILLDLNLPRMDGISVLEELKKNKGLKHIPVVILTTSQQQEHVFQTYELCANCFVRKPVDFHQFTEVVRTIEHFWFQVVSLPLN